MSRRETAWEAIVAGPCKKSQEEVKRDSEDLSMVEKQKPQKLLKRAEVCNLAFCLHGIVLLQGRKCR